MDPASQIAAATPPRAPKPPQKQPDYADAGPVVEFPTPPDFVPPDVVKSNETFEALGTFRMKDDGSMCLLAVDGAVVKPFEQKPKNEPTPPQTAADALRQGLPTTGIT